MWLLRSYHCGIGVLGLKLFVAGSLIACALAVRAQAPSSDVDASASTGPSDAPSLTHLEAAKLSAEAAKLRAEVDKLRAEVDNLRTLDPGSRWWAAWLTAGGTLVAAFATLVAGGIGWIFTRAVKGTGERKLQQERELGREEHNLEVFQYLSGSRAAATVLLERLKRLLQKKRLDDVERAEPSVLKNVLVAALKTGRPNSPHEKRINGSVTISSALSGTRHTLLQAGAGRESTGSTASEPSNPPSSRPDPILCKYIADEMVKIIPKAKFIRGKLPKNVDGESPLTGLDFQKCFLREIYWADVDARGVDFFESDLAGGASLRGAALQRAKFYQASMEGIVLEGADLTLANLSGARLREADLQKATLTRANLQGADLTDAKLKDADLREAVYNDRTKWPSGFNPQNHGAILVNEVYRPEQTVMPWYCSSAMFRISLIRNIACDIRTAAKP